MITDVKRRWLRKTEDGRNVEEDCTYPIRPARTSKLRHTELLVLKKEHSRGSKGAFVPNMANELALPGGRQEREDCAPFTYLTKGSQLILGGRSNGQLVLVRGYSI